MRNFFPLSLKKSQISVDVSALAPSRVFLRERGVCSLSAGCHKAESDR